MNRRITLPELSLLLADITGFDSKACMVFLRDLFSTVSETIAAGENVKVKGLGTFKCVSVEQRKSVNVNTGEEMIIPEHRKVTFTPDKALAEAINQPFAMFEPVELNDEVTEQMLNNEAVDSPALPSVPDKNGTEEFEENNSSAQQAKEIPVEENIATKQVESVPESIPFIEYAEETDEKHELNQRADDETENGEIHETQESAEQVSDNNAGNPDENESEVLQSDQDPNDNSAEMTFFSDEEDFEQNTRRLKKRNHSHFGKGVIVGILSVLLLLVIACLIWRFSLPESFNRTVDYIFMNDRQIVDVEDAYIVSTDIKDTVTYAVKKSSEATENEQIQPALSEEKADVPTQISDKERSSDNSEAQKSQKKEQTQPTYFNDKITKKRYLTTMAREYYGNYNLWPFIYDYNPSLGHPDRIRPGTQIKVPSLETLGIDPKDNNIIREAKARGVAIYAKYR